MKKAVSLLLTGLMAFSAVSAGAVSASAATTEEPAAIAFEAGSDIVFDNTNTGWGKVYLYSWGMGYFGDFVEMDKGEGATYTAVAPVDVEAGTECFLFTNTTDWSGKQTPNIVTEEGKNTYKPIVDENGNVISVEQSFTPSSTDPKVVATPNSKSFSESLTVNLYAFNTTNAKYTVNGGKAEDLNGSASITLTASADIDILVDGTVVKSYEYTCVTIPDTNITVSAVYNDKVTPYTGEMYVYTYGGDRLAPGFEPMTNDGEGNYSYTFKGTAHVIFTTTNSWDTAVKFIIGDPTTDDQEPFVSSETFNSFDLTLPLPVPTPEA